MSSRLVVCFLIVVDVRCALSFCISNTSSRFGKGVYDVDDEDKSATRHQAKQQRLGDGLTRVETEGQEGASSRGDGFSG